jgi:hypothetical protein
MVFLFLILPEQRDARLVTLFITAVLDYDRLPINRLE